jgi:hypothetical protein
MTSGRKSLRRPVARAGRLTVWVGKNIAPLLGGDRGGELVTGGGEMLGPGERYVWPQTGDENKVEVIHC